MLRLQNQQLVSSLRTAAAFPLPASSLLRRLLSSTCVITPSQAPKASRSRANLTTPDLDDAVRAFLIGDLGISESDVASTIIRSARKLRVEVDKTLAPCVSLLRDIGLSTSEIARLLRLAPSVFVSPKHALRLGFYMSLLGSFDKVHAAIRRNNSLLFISIEDVLKPNMALLRQCNLTVRDIAQTLVRVPRLLAGSKERLEDVILRAEQLGVPRGTPMFRYALVAAYSAGQKNVTSKMELLKSLGLSSCQVAMAVAKMPTILGCSDDRLRRAMDFLIKEAGVDMEVIARSPTLLMFSIEWRLTPRLKVLKLLQEKGLPGSNWCFYNMACLSEKLFHEKFVRPHEKSIPAFTSAYAAARPGKALHGAATS